MNWKNGRPEGMKEALRAILDKAYEDGSLSDDMSLLEAGADAMHKADLEFLREFPDLVRVMQAHMTKQQWLEFVGKGR